MSDPWCSRSLLYLKERMKCCVALCRARAVESRGWAWVLGLFGSSQKHYMMEGVYRQGFGKKSWGRSAWPPMVERRQGLTVRGVVGRHSPRTGLVGYCRSNHGE